MDYKFLDKVLDQIISETEFDYNGIRGPFPYSYDQFPPPFLSPPYQFYGHCMSVYGLNDNEIEYVWGRYKEIIKNIIKKG